MSLCLNARRNRLRVPPSLDLSSEFDLIALWQAQWMTFLFPLRGGRFTGGLTPWQWRRPRSNGKYELSG